MTADRSAQQRESILAKTAEALCERPGLDMQALAEATGVSRATLYRYFPNREALIRALVFQSIADIDAAVDGIFDGLKSYREAFRALVEAIVPLGASYHFLTREWSALDDPEVRAALQKQEIEVAELVDEAKKAGELDRTLPTRWIAQQLDAVMWVAWSEVADGHVARNAAADLAFRTFWGGVCASPRRSTRTKRGGNRT